MHRIKSAIYILILVGIVVAIGLVISNKSGSLTGAIIGPTIACYDNADCNDRIDATKDLCLDPGTINSLCVNRPEK